MAQSAKSRFTPLSKNELIGRMQENGLKEVDLQLLTNEGRKGTMDGFVYIKIIDVNANDTIGGRSFCSFPFWQLNFEKDTEKEDAMGMLLMEKKSYGATGRCLTSEMRIVVTGCRVETSVGGCDGYPLALILDEAASGTVFVVNDSSESTDGRSAQLKSKSSDETKRRNVDDDTGIIYTKLSNIAAVTTDRVNVYGVVQWFQEEKVEGRRRVRFTIADPSVADSDHISCNLTEDPYGRAQLPDIRQSGDIIRLHRVAIGRKPSGETCLYGRMGAVGLSAVIWDGVSGGNMTPRSTSSQNYTLEDKDYKIVRHLRQCLAKSNQPMSPEKSKFEAPSDLVPVSRFPRGGYQSIFVQVLGLWNHAYDCALLRVTDGTKSLFKPSKLLEGTEQRPKRQYLHPILDGLPEDCVFDVFVYDQYKKSAMALKAKDFVLIKNVHLAMVNGQRETLAYTVHGKTRGEQYGRGLYKHEPSSPLAIDLQKRLDGYAKNHPAQAATGEAPIANTTTTSASEMATTSKVTAQDDAIVNDQDQPMDESDSVKCSFGDEFTAIKKKSTPATYEDAAVNAITESQAGALFSAQSTPKSRSRLPQGGQDRSSSSKRLNEETGAGTTKGCDTPTSATLPSLPPNVRYGNGPPRTRAEHQRHAVDTEVDRVKNAVTATKRSSITPLLGQASIGDAIADNGFTGHHSKRTRETTSDQRNEKRFGNEGEQNDDCQPMETDDVTEATGGIDKATFVINGHDQDIDGNPAALFLWSCPSCKVRLPFDEHFAKLLSHWIKCKKCSGKEGKDVPFDVISRFHLSATLISEPDVGSQVQLLAEGAVSDAVLGRKAKYVWRNLRCAPEKSMLEVKKRLDGLIGQRRSAAVRVNEVDDGSGEAKRTYVIMEWM